MESFNQLLNQYVQRAGISDTELARTIGVSRQTIFRWREGMTARPRHRGDVLVIARKLRLSPEERDRLLLSAGFPPEEAVEAGPQGEETTPGLSSEEAERAEIRSSPLRTWGWAALGMGLLLIIGLATWWGAPGRGRPTPTGEADPPFSVVPAPAGSGDTAILVTHFANYAGSQLGYNVAGRLAEALQREIEGARLDVQVRVWPEAVGERRQALAVGRASKATLVIYGEYDVGRVVVQFAHPDNGQIFADPAVQRYVTNVQELSTTLNSDLPEQVRSLALLALGQIYLHRSDVEQARPLLLQARDTLKNNRAVDDRTRAVVDFYLGVAYQYSQPPALDEAIRAYTGAIEAWPQMVSSRLNRAAAFERRRQPGDLELALADAGAVLAVAPDWATAYNNRAAIRIRLGGAENLALALEDLETALKLNPSSPEAHLNRAYIYLAQGAPMKKAAPDLETAIALNPDYAEALNLLCWGYAINGQPEQAMPHCRQAIAIEPRPLYLDSRGVVHALLGEYPAAAADFRAYVLWLEAQPQSRPSELALRRTWIETLEAGQNPITSEVLVRLRQEFGP